MHLARLLRRGCRMRRSPPVVMSHCGSMSRPNCSITRRMEILAVIYGRMAFTCEVSRESGCRWLKALTHAHTQGVLHRDIKPSNLLLDAHGVVWITDFGLAKQEGSDLTHSGDVVGTLLIWPPNDFAVPQTHGRTFMGLGLRSMSC